jgi:hypothetical protein
MKFYVIRSKALIFRRAKNCIENGGCCHAYVIEYSMMIGMNDVHCILENFMQ